MDRIDTPTTWPRRLARIWHHLWTDDGDLRRSMPPTMIDRIQARVAASEHRHSGEIRIYAEAALPLSYLLRDATPRDRAVAMFGKLRVWDTEHNNGVLIYLLLAEHAIEIVADRGLNRHVSTPQWRALIDRMSAEFRKQAFEDGLTLALEEVSALMMAHFALDESSAANPNELPDRPELG